VSVLDVRDLVVDFRQHGGTRLRAVDHVSFGLEKGGTLALAGESGSGKSAVVRALGQLVRPVSGTVLLDGRAAWQHGRFWVNDPDCLMLRPGVERRFGD
jgi:ABC-type oligopeptide transport system ATPase subunit